MIEIDKIPDHVIQVYKGTVKVQGIIYTFFIQDTLEWDIKWDGYPHVLSQKEVNVLQNQIREHFITEFYNNDTKQ
jgi:hypothetical protein